MRHPAFLSILLLVTGCAAITQDETDERTCGDQCEEVDELRACDPSRTRYDVLADDNTDVKEKFKAESKDTDRPFVESRLSCKSLRRSFWDRQGGADPRESPLWVPELPCWDGTEPYACTGAGGGDLECGCRAVEADTEPGNVPEEARYSGP